ncbi:hypothetical protein [Streptomyces sp. XY58]|nr:hypothetical protein [Streptomyces sp. XY58]
MATCRTSTSGAPSVMEKDAVVFASTAQLAIVLGCRADGQAPAA